MRITSKGQVTIPLAIRQELGLLPWCEVEFAVDGDSVRVRKTQGAAGRGRRVLEAMGEAPRPKGGMTTDELMALTRG